jgi:signal transduction histidine kinase
VPRSTPSVWPVVRDAVAGAPLHVRRIVGGALVGWVALIVLQALDSSNAPGAAGLAEFLSAAFGATGGLLLVMAALLERRARAGRAPTTDTEALRRVLFALPALALVAAVFVSVAITLMIVRALLGAAAPFVILMTAFYAGVLWVAAHMAVRAARTLYEHAAAEAAVAARARVEAGEAQLAALQARMNPHFLFNALNTVAALVRTDALAAERVTESLAGVLRMTLDRSAGGMSTVADELEHARAYFGVEQERWGNRLHVTWDVDPALHSLPVPPLVLQPLLENALHHGLGGRAGGGAVRITIRRVAGHLHLVVEDDGEGFPARVTERTGLGNLRQRLSTIFGPEAALEIGGGDVGARVTVVVPIVESHAHSHR